MGRRKMKPNNFKVAHNTQDWWGFTLQRGHVFGLYKPDPDKCGVCYVSGGEPDGRRRNCLVAYQQTVQTANPNCYHWNPVSVHVDSPLGKLILDTLRTSPYDGVQVAVDYTRVRREWQPMPENYKSQDGQSVYFIDGKPRPNFPTFRSKRPETAPRLPKVRVVSHMADSVDCKAIEVSAETAKLWSGNNAAAETMAKERHKETWIRDYMSHGGRQDRATVEAIYNKIYA